MPLEKFSLSFPQIQFPSYGSDRDSTERHVRPQNFLPVGFLVAGIVFEDTSLRLRYAPRIHPVFLAAETLAAVGATLIGLLENWPIQNCPVIFGLLFKCDINFPFFRFS